MINNKENYEWIEKLPMLARISIATQIDKGELELAQRLVLHGLQTDGGHHKQWFLEEIGRVLGLPIEEIREIKEWGEGVPP